MRRRSTARCSFFTAVLAIVTGILFGLLPALQLSRPDVTSALKDGGRTGTAGRSRQLARRGLVVLQLASSVVLALAAGLLIRSLIELNRIDLGFNPSNVLTAQLQVPATAYPQPADVVRFYRQAAERVAQIPGVRAVGAVRVLPLARSIGDWSIKIEGRPVRARRKSERRLPGRHARLFPGDGTDARPRPLPDRCRSRRRDAGRRDQRHDGGALLAERRRDRPAVHDGHRRQALADHRRHRRHRAAQRRRRRAARRDVSCARAVAGPHPIGAARHDAGRQGRPSKVMARNPLALDGTGPGRGASHRSQPAGVRHQDDGAGDGVGIVAAPVRDVPAGALRGHRADARGDRHLRNDLAAGRRAHAGDGHSPRARRESAGDPQAGAGPGHAADGDRAW